MTIPRVFISYSHDSASHKSWVLDFATTLRNRGIDAVLDQWDLKPGDDLPHFMEYELSKCDYVIMVCTETYVSKANAGEGGVGYEKMIMTSSLMKKIDSNKVIPIIRQTGNSQRPTFLQSKLYIDFSKDEDVEYSLDELLRTLLDAPLYEKPEIGKNPFKPLESSRPDRSADGLKELMMAFALAFENRPQDYVTMNELLPQTKLHKLSFERFLENALEEGLILEKLPQWYSVSQSGYDYIIAHGIIDA